ncbi:uncharacterized protein [Primulina eburnea]|uniref:uncharacterized protein isoform X1 n=1 Tax=Primulina eburnea TaxID=1245227 RepID=UPI003C6C2575
MDSNNQSEDEEEKSEEPFTENKEVLSDESLLDHDMTTISEHHFGETEDGFSIRIIENMKEEYGLYVWPCSIILAEYIWQHKTRFSGANVVEQLGAGTSLPGLVAVKVGADVTLTDDSNRSEVLDNMRRVCKLNDIKCKVMGLTWGVWDAPVFTLQPNIILGADVLYDSTKFDDLFATVSFLLHKHLDSVFITTYHNRSGHHLIELLMVKWGLKCTKLVDGFSFMPSHKASRLSGNIQLVEIVLDAF